MSLLLTTVVHGAVDGEVDGEPVDEHGHPPLSGAPFTQEGVTYNESDASDGILLMSNHTSKQALLLALADLLAG